MQLDRHAHRPRPLRKIDAIGVEQIARAREEPACSISIRNNSPVAGTTSSAVTRGAIASRVIRPTKRQCAGTISGHAALTEVADLPIETAVRKLVTVASRSPSHRPETAPRPRRADSGTPQDVEAFNREIHTLVRAYLESRRKEMRKIDPGLATFICVSAIEAVAHNTVLNQAQMQSEKTVRTLVDGTTRMVVGYLR
ncbi:TetR/AcrR family transcriptional regulator [Bradyrhizobium sp. 139]|uniref:TetR/AcrR family transcriptional regulator n=1 Tax=Bradyrhizobium sp. 139 TaxID=2782616 RepID=UPI001FFB727A|nr:TetR/AcrR family transcriptional regulator [Bradyrhizobium sp. 139]